MERKKILVVDDEPRIAEVLREYFERDGFAVEVAGTVAKALAALQRAAPAILLLDVTLPDGSGLDVLPRRGVAGRARSHDHADGALR
jgi:two-component system response regulator HydG